MKTVETDGCVGDAHLSLHQLVSRTAGDYSEHYVVVGFVDNGVVLQDPEFNFDAFVVDAETFSKNYEPVTAGDHPVWGH